MSILTSGMIYDLFSKVVLVTVWLPKYDDSSDQAIVFIGMSL